MNPSILVIKLCSKFKSVVWSAEVDTLLHRAPYKELILHL